MGVLKAKVGGVWVPVSQGFSSATVGYIGHAYGPTSDTAHTSPNPITGMSVTWTAIAGHTYRTIANASFAVGTAGGIVDLLIFDAANTTMVSQMVNVNAAGTYVALTAVEVFTAGATGSVTRKAGATVNSGTLTLMGAFSRKAIILVEDITQVQPADTSIEIANARVGGTWRRVAAQSIPNSTLTAITFDTEDEDSHGFLTPPGATFTVPAGYGGIYMFSFTGYTAVEGGMLQLSLPNSGGMTPSARCNAFNAWATVSVVWPMVAGAQMNCAAWQNSGSAQNLTGRFSMYRISK